MTEHNDPTGTRQGEGQVAVVFGYVNDGVPPPVALRCTGLGGLLRLAGSARMELPDQTALLAHVRGAFQNLPLKDIVLMSGGTRVLDGDGQVAMSILELPSQIREWHPRCLTLGSAPCPEETSSLTGSHSRFVPCDDITTKTIVHPDLDMVWLVRVRGTTSDYSLDVPLYFDLMNGVRAKGGKTGLWVWGGGEVTAVEITQALLRGHPCAVVAGSGRVADALVTWLEGEGNRKAIDPTYLGYIQRLLDEGADPNGLTVVYSPIGTVRWLGRSGLLAKAGD